MHVRLIASKHQPAYIFKRPACTKSFEHIRFNRIRQFFTNTILYKALKNDYTFAKTLFKRLHIQINEMYK